ncbi:MutS-related protein [Maribellus sediminis]|uniref:MutS-related protein n=1 Tax=Maribellus sediminis TaxID=2696285 RepID=UPI001431BF95|nr:hypothetical protein [Maribellus sediminis]
MTKPLDFYRKKLDEYSSESSRLTVSIRRFAWYRFLAFVLIFVPVIVFGLSWINGAISLLFLVLFFYLIKVNIELDKRRKRAAVLKEMVEAELKALDHSFLHFNSGSEFLDADHFYAYDLDLFGDGSVFQFLNRTSTFGGKNRLANYLLRPDKDAAEIRQRQAAVAELSKMPQWRLDFLADGNLFDESEQMTAELQAWSETELDLNGPETIKWLIRVVPFFTVIAVLPAVFGMSNLYLSVFVLLQWSLMSVYWKRISYFYRFFGRKSELLAKYMNLLARIEQTDFKSEKLFDLQKQIKEPSAGKAFQELKNLVKQFEYRGNLLVGFFLNSFFTWDIRCVYRLWKWHGLHHKHLAKWLEVVAEFDALISLSNYANNHPASIFPEVVEDEFLYSAKDLGHPLLNPSKMVRNDLEINGYSKVLIVTGANMAGKSTFLRTVGVNLVLAEAGAPVCATEMQFTPIDIYTNMRTTDSLLKDESYFFAELKRIKTILDHLKNGERYFVILDEMLKGTNSVDKLNGSKELIRKLVQLYSVSLIATHDLKLSELEQEFPGKVSNTCFEIRIENNELIFDYKLSAGVTKTMNATFLMRKIGII